MARKESFALLARSAAFLASINACSACLRAVMSCAVPATWLGLPSASYVSSPLPLIRAIAFGLREPIRAMKPDSLEFGRRFCGGYAGFALGIGDP
ncbi:MAG: hypothetical protein NTY05_13750, partial [Rhodocyclales bacterium]|nr:hypothetical protein [Rhodocyclales bacterium]